MKRATTRKEGPCCMCPDQSLYPCSLSAVFDICGNIYLAVTIHKTT